METLKGLPRDHPDLIDTNVANNDVLRQSTDPTRSDHREDQVFIPDSETQTGLDLNYTAYSRIWNVADNTPFSGKKTVVVIVTWESYAKRVVFSSVI